MHKHTKMATNVRKDSTPHYVINAINKTKTSQTLQNEISETWDDNDSSMSWKQHKKFISRKERSEIMIEF